MNPTVNRRFSATVAICTFNGAGRMPIVLQAIAEQTAAHHSFELLVIDNASTDNTRAACEQAFKTIGGVSCRVILEPQAGLSFARNRAAREAQGRLLLFLDDDNIPAPNWVKSAIEAFDKYPKAGVIGGKVIPRWEVPPTPLAEAVAPFALAICDIGDQVLQIKAAGGGIVGAGMCVRTELLRQIYDHPGTSAAVTGRTGGNLMSGEDLAISIIARSMAWECWYVPQMKIEHCLPEGRMHKEYLLRLYEGIGRGQAAVRCLYDWKARTPLRLLIGIKDYLRWRKRKYLRKLHRPADEDSEIAGDLHDLDQKLTYGRAMEAMRIR